MEGNEKTEAGASPPTSDSRSAASAASSSGPDDGGRGRSRSSGKSLLYRRHGRQRRGAETFHDVEANKARISSSIFLISARSSASVSQGTRGWSVGTLGSRRTTCRSQRIGAATRQDVDARIASRYRALSARLRRAESSSHSRESLWLRRAASEYRK